MISKIKINVVAVCILALGVFAGAAMAQDTTTTPNTDAQKQDKFQRRGRLGRQGDFGPGMRRRPEAMLRMFRDLNLTDAQKGQIKTILESNRPDQASQDQLKALREVRKSGGQLTTEQKQQLKAVRQAQKANMQSVHEQIMNVLTPEQKAQLDAKRKEREQRFQDRKQFRRQNRPTTDQSTTKTIAG
jgi:Spy/CpxP family protein refolding chaperone